MNYKFCIPILKYVQYYSDIFNAIYINSLENDVSDIYKLLALIGTICSINICFSGKQFFCFEA
jgi:hypothetical protein